MAFDIRAIRHPKERIHGNATLVAGAALWALFWFELVGEEDPLVAILALSSICLLLWGFSAAGNALTRAYMFGNYVLVGPEQFPHIDRMVKEGAQRLGMSEAPLTFVYNSSGVINAMALRLIGKGRYIWLTSALIDTDNEEQLRFVIGHELGHHVAGHLDTLPYILRWPVFAVPFLGAAYSRGRELTCDRIGAFLVQDMEISRSALQVLACGSAKLNSQMNAAAFAAQEKLVPPIAGFFVKAMSGYPSLTKRVEEVARWLEGQSHLLEEIKQGQSLTSG